MNAPVALSAPGPVAAPTHRGKFNFSLEALRGLAALTVMWHHVIVRPKQLDPGYAPSGVFAYNPPGHFAVLIFFVLSGYVIGLAQREPLRRGGVLPYLRKRFVRIYPIYALSILAAYVVAHFSYSPATLGWHLLFGQEIAVPLIFENNPLWSLQYEVLFYLLFIPLSMLRVPPLLTAGAAALLGLAGLCFDANGFGGASAQYLIGFSFWALGWAMAREQPAAAPVSSRRLLSALLLLLAVGYVNVLDTVFVKLTAWFEAHPLAGIAPATWPRNHVINLVDFAALPYAWLIISRFAGTETGWKRWAGLALQLLPAATALYLVRHLHEPKTPEFALPMLFYVVSTALYFVGTARLETGSQRLIQRLIPVGSISYGLYVIHFPVLIAVQQIAAFSGSALTFAVRAVAFVLLTVLAAWVLEKQFQPLAKRWLG